MGKKLFGTDGIRGIANEIITPELALNLGLAAGAELRKSKAKPNVVLGRDTRLSGTMIGAALAAGFNSAGCEVLSLGVAPTGAVSYIARTGDFDLAAVISASHNPAEDNGIKFIASNGCKVTDEFEIAIENGLGNSPKAAPLEVGRIDQSKGELARYEQYLMSLCPEGLRGLRICVDGANGAAYQLGSDVLENLGAEIIRIGNTPNGFNINAEGGATKPHILQEAVVKHGADVGLAYDGDADRAIFSDSQGRLINGDRMMAFWAIQAQKEGVLTPNAVVGTVMSNGGYQAFLEANGIELHRADVGDKYVAAKMRELDAKIGGEQSGHIIISEFGPTGDGLITAIAFFRTIIASGLPASHAVDSFENWPQLLTNLTVNEPKSWANIPAVKEAVEQAEVRIKGVGHVNVRPSGTQPMLRLMVEARELALRDEISSHLVKVILDSMGGKIYSAVDLTHALGD